jgi:hypothetical protein
MKKEESKERWDERRAYDEAHAKQVSNAKDYTRLEDENEKLRSFLYDLANMIRGGDEDYACREITQWHREQGHD